jgi:integrase
MSNASILDFSERDLSSPNTSLRELVKLYFAAPEFLDLRDSTKFDYSRVIQWLLVQAGDVSARKIETRHIYALRDLAFAARKRRFANYVVQVIRLLLRWGRERNHVDTNVAEGVKCLKRPLGLRANRPWSDVERRIVLEAAPIELRSVITLGMFAGLREADACSLPNSAYDGERIRVVAAKNQEELVIRVHYQLRETLLEAANERAAKARRRSRRRSNVRDPDTLVVTSRGRTWTPSGFRASFFKLIRALEAERRVDPGLTFHGLRHTLGKLVMEAGGSKEDIGLILGDRSLAMATFYSREFEKITRTDAMVRRLEAVDIRKAIGLTGALPFSSSR